MLSFEGLIYKNIPLWYDFTQCWNRFSYEMIKDICLVDDISPRYHSRQSRQPEEVDFQAFTTTTKSNIEIESQWKSQWNETNSLNIPQWYSRAIQIILLILYTV